jgi:gliding motility-associated-like protein
VLPEIIFDIVDSGCDRSTGAAEAIVINNVLVNEILWTDINGNFLTLGVGLFNQFAGDYIATVTTFLGCQNSAVATIRTEITSYNAVSANGDGLNDVFEIDCITNFPNNNVKIFNRAGVLVYEADGYNNTTIVFDGKGIRGAYVMGDLVPDGTYFYIIDKRDGSKPKTGYLELIR